MRCLQRSRSLLGACACVCVCVCLCPSLFSSGGKDLPLGCQLARLATYKTNEARSSLCVGPSAGPAHAATFSISTAGRLIPRYLWSSCVRRSHSQQSPTQSFSIHGGITVTHAKSGGLRPPTGGSSGGHCWSLVLLPSGERCQSGGGGRSSSLGGGRGEW